MEWELPASVDGAGIAPGEPRRMQALKSSESDTRAPAVESARRGIEICRQGDWQEGFYHLSLAAEAPGETGALPSQFFAFLGYCLARVQGEVGQGLKLCRRSVEIDPYEGEGYYYLARTFLLAGDRRSAIDARERGLRNDAGCRPLLELRSEMGERRPAVLPFLPRRHFLNRTLGRLRHSLLGARRTARRGGNGKL